jgi:hypothetical protein
VGACLYSYHNIRTALTRTVHNGDTRPVAMVAATGRDRHSAVFGTVSGTGLMARCHAYLARSSAPS